MTNAPEFTRPFTLALTCAAAFLLPGQASDAATLPFSENFESATPGDDAPAGFVESPGSNWSVTTSDPVSGSQSYLGESNDDGSIFTLIDFSGSLGGPAATASDFIFTAQVRPENMHGGSGSVTVALVALGSSDFSDGYEARVHGGGGMRFVSYTGGSSSIQGLDSDQGTITVGETYLFTLTGTYADSNNDQINDQLTLFFNIEGPNMSGQGVTLVTSAPKTGAHFGLRLSESGSRNVSATFDNISMIVPEPASLALMALGGVLVLGRRRRGAGRDV